MIRKIHIKNFRCFEDHEIVFQRSAILVGRNNAGKSTLVEALRLVALVADRHKTSVYHAPPGWTGLPMIDVGIQPALHGFDFSDASLFYHYGDPPAIIDVLFTTGQKIKIYLGGGAAIHSVLRGSQNRPIAKKSEAQKLRLPTISALPPVAPLRVVEKVLSEEHVRHAVSSSLSPLHFRNQLAYFKSHYRRFKDLCESMWPRLQVQSLEKSGTTKDPTLSLLIRDDNFVAEVGRMGHGLQVWMQIMWYLARSKGTSTIILDEPDTYLHADLQRKLLGALRGRFKQVLLATHSVEIMAEVAPEDILIVERARKRSLYATDLASVQRIVDNVGGAHNLHLARLASAKRCVLVEGKDMKILKLFQDLFFPKSEESFGTIPSFSVGGWSGWREAVGSAKSMKNALGQRVNAYCIFDRDYHTVEELDDRYAKAKEAGIRLHIWQKKEIENYLLAIGAVRRSIMHRGDTEVSDEEVAKQLELICDSLREDTEGAIADAYQQRNRQKSPSTAMKRARSIADESWTDLTGKLAIVSGKRVLSLMSAWAQSNFKVMLNAPNIVRHMRPTDVADEMREVVQAIEENAVIRVSKRRETS